MAAPSLTYTLTNGQTADASQVMQNFNDILNGITDGTKDLSISALTCAGAATLNGHVTLGNSSADDITVTGSLASSIPIKTTNTYNIGSSTLGLAGVYLGANSQTVRLVGSGSMASTWTMTLPTSAGSAGQFLRNEGSGVTSWYTAADTNRITASYTITDTDGYTKIVATTAPTQLTFSSRSGDTVTVTAPHGMATGCPIYMDSATTPFSGSFTNGTVCYAIVISSTSFKFATSIANALAGTAITLSSDGTGTHTFTCGVAVILPTAADNTDRKIVIKKGYAGNGMVAVIPEAVGETIDGLVGITLAGRHDAATLSAENGVWYMDNYYQSFLYAPPNTAGSALGSDFNTMTLRVSRNGAAVTLDIDLSLDGAIGTSGAQSTTAIVPSWARPATECFTVVRSQVSNEYLVEMRVQTDGTIQFLAVDIDSSGLQAIQNFAASEAFRACTSYNVA